MWQQGILLSTVPAVHLINEKNRALVVQPPALGRFFDDTPQVRYARQHGAQVFKVCLGGIGNHARQSCFPGPGRAIEDDGGKQSIGLNGPPQE